MALDSWWKWQGLVQSSTALQRQQKMLKQTIPHYSYFIQSNKILEIFSQIFAHFNSGVNKEPFADEKTHGQEFKSKGHQIKFYVGNNWKFRLSLLGTGQEFTWLKLKINRFIWLFIDPCI